MARFDKYDGKTGGFRAPLEAAIAIADVGKIYAVSINASGRAVIAEAAIAETAISGVICAVRPMAAGEPIDVMTAGEIEEATATGGAALTLGAPVFAHATGIIDNTAAAGKAIGITVARASRLIVRVSAATT